MQGEIDAQVKKNEELYIKNEKRLSGRDNDDDSENDVDSLKQEIERLKETIASLSQELLEANNLREQNENEWDMKEQEFLEGLAKMEEESNVQLEE